MFSCAVRAAVVAPPSAVGATGGLHNRPQPRPSWLRHVWGVMSETSHRFGTSAAPATRSAFVRAARTNNPLAPPAGLDPRSPEGRRWRDLARYFGQRLGAERLRDEAQRALLLNLVSITLEIERIRDTPTATQPQVHTRLHLMQEQRCLLAELGLSGAARNGEPSALRDLLRDSNGGAP